MATDLAPSVLWAEWDNLGLPQPTFRDRSIVFASRSFVF
jgi:hypothetical protein